MIYVFNDQVFFSLNLYSNHPPPHPKKCPVVGNKGYMAMMNMTLMKF